jgi:hypothetical protein
VKEGIGNVNRSKRVSITTRDYGGTSRRKCLCCSRCCCCSIDACFSTLRCESFDPFDSKINRMMYYVIRDSTLAIISLTAAMTSHKMTDGLTDLGLTHSSLSLFILHPSCIPAFSLSRFLITVFLIFIRSSSSLFLSHHNTK